MFMGLISDVEEVCVLLHDQMEEIEQVSEFDHKRSLEISVCGIYNDSSQKQLNISFNRQQIAQSVCSLKIHLYISGMKLENKLIVVNRKGTERNEC